ncbi:MAG: DUF4159 domain-containing protein [Pseudomonadota bacterium]
MASIGALAFLNPWVLAGLIALPILWWLLRAIPPSPRVEAFAGVRLLLGLEDEERQSDKTPWWLLLLRCIAVAAILTGFAQPVLNPSDRLGETDGPVLIVMDQGWASAPDWATRKAAAAGALDEAEDAGRDVLFWPLGSGEVPVPVSAAAARRVLDVLEPAPWAPDRAALVEALSDLPPGQTLWFHDGLAHIEEADALMDALSARGPLRLIGPVAPAVGLTPPRLEDGRMLADVLRAGGGEETRLVVAFGEAEEGGERRIAVTPATFAPGDDLATAEFDLPAELIGTITRLIMAQDASAGGAALADGSLKRVPTGLVAPVAEDAVASLTSASHYLREALEPWSVIREGSVAEVMATGPAALVLADHGAFGPEDETALVDWVTEGGVMVRFAGPRLAAAISERFGSEQADPLLPVTLRRGGRVLGGALAWSKPRTLGPFNPDGPFRRLTVPDEVDVRTQVLAEPSPDLAGRVWASLDDGTPLVTAKKMGAGWVVLFHVTADAEWSSLPLSGLLVEMLGQVMSLSPGRAASVPEAEELAGTLWRADLLLGPDGAPRDPAPGVEPVAGETLAGGRAGPGTGPGIYLRADEGAGGAGAATRMAVNLFATGDTLAPLPDAPLGTVVETLGGVEAQKLGHWLITLAVLLMLIDLIATLWLAGRLSPRTSGVARGAAGGGVAMLAVALAMTAPEARAQSSDGDVVSATAETTLGYVLTGSSRVDAVSEQAMRGLGMTLAARTSVEPGPPMGVDPARDPLQLYPVLYWPLLSGLAPDQEGLERLAEYLTGGGLLVIDTQNGATGFGGTSAVEMRQIARALNLPALAPVDGDHVLTRTFYLLDRFPGRWRGGNVWAEAPPPDDGIERDPSIPQFDRIDDNVSPVIVGSADWASAWAVDEQGFFAFPVGRSGDRQREMALRFGVNLVLYALTGNYKSDQVHAPAVLERLGQ